MASNFAKATAQAKQYILTEAVPAALEPSAPVLTDEPPPPYQTLPSAAATSSLYPPMCALGSDTPPTYGSDSNGACGSTGQPAMKLGYMDFVPQLLRKRILKNNVFESFR